jgi:hypothetical protein
MVLDECQYLGHSRIFHRYENGDPLIRFTEGQLSEIRETTLAKILCSNADNIPLLQRSVFDLPDPFL